MPYPQRTTSRIAVRTRLSAALLLLASGCASPLVQDRGWLEARSTNFTLYTSLDEASARGLIEHLELFRAAIGVLTRVRNVEPRVPTEIYAFRSQHDYRPFDPFADSAGFFRPTLRVNYLALSADANAAQAREILYHEYTHFVLRNEGSGHPLWFEEGFADLLSSLDVRGANVRIGVPPASRTGALQHGAPLPWSRVLRARSYEGFGPAALQMFYAQSWLLVHHLVLGGGGAKVSGQLSRYVRQIEGRVREERAFREAFGIEVADLDARLEKYQQTLPIFGLPRAKLSAPVAARVRPVRLDEIRTRLGWLAIANEKPVLARRLFESASAANPNQARAIAGLAETHKFARRWDEAEAGYRRALALDPDDWRNPLDLARCLVDRVGVEDERRAERLDQAREQLARVIERAPETPEAHATLGLAQAMGGEVGSGIASLERALALLPANAQIEYPLAQLHAYAGHRARAIELLRNVASRVHDGSDTDALKLLETLESGTD